MRGTAEEWRASAACRGMGNTAEDIAAFFPERGELSDAAKAICERCSVVEECREYALSNVIRQGIFGGTSERWRRRERHQRMRERVGMSREPEPVREAAPDWVPEEYRGLWPSKRRARRATFGAGTVESKRIARALARAG